MMVRKWLISTLTFASLALAISISNTYAMKPPLSRNVDYGPEEIVIKTTDRKLVYRVGGNDVLTFSIAVGKTGRKWNGTTVVTRKVRNPSWAPPPLVRKSNPQLPSLIKAGPNNPLGVAVLVLGDGTYGIHGTNKDESIGTDASFGCFRMHNADILVLFRRVKIGTVVRVEQ